MYASLGSHLNGSSCRSKVVPSVYSPERGVVARLYTVFQNHIFSLGQLGEVVQLLLVNAVGTCADNYTRHIGMGKGLVVALSKTLQRGVGIREGLEICQITLRRAVTAAVKFDSLVNLLGDALLALAVRRREGVVTAKRTSAPRKRAISIGATEACIDSHLLHARAESALEVCRIAIEAALISSWIWHCVNYSLVRKQFSLYKFNQTIVM